MGKRQRTKHVPEELIEEILTNLPAKSLLRFKSVSKSWRSIICTKTFTNAHLKKSNHQRLMICSRDYGNRKLTLSSSSLKFLLSDLNSQDYSPIPSLQHPPLLGHSDVTSTTKILGSCNGLILLAFRSPRYLILWNPSTRQINNIPPPPKACAWTAYGFEYDDSTDDYKIVSILTSDEEYLETHIYSLKTNSWRKIANFDVKGCYPIHRDPGKYFNGKLHWRALSGNTLSENTAVIFSLDLAQGKYDIFACPQQLLHFLGDNWRLDVLGGYLCLVSYFKLWIMNKYGDPESWTSTYAFSYSGIPIWLAENRDVSVALRGSTVIIYDQITKSHTSRAYSAAGAIEGHCIYVETLVSPFGHQNLGQ